MTVDFWDLTKLLLRRWYFSVPMLLLSTVGTVLGVISVEPDYQATAHVQILPPATAQNAPHAARNPWTDLDISAIGSAAIIAVSDERMIDRLAEGGFSDEVEFDLQGRAPIIIVRAVGISRAQASATARELVRLIHETIAELQRPYNLPNDRLITTRTLDTGDNIEVLTSRLKRVVAALAAAGLLLTVGVTVGLDAMVAWRNRRRAAHRAAPVAAPVLRQRDGRDDERSDVREDQHDAKQPDQKRLDHKQPVQKGEETTKQPPPEDDATRPLPVSAVARRDPVSDATVVIRQPEKREPRRRTNGRQ
jgi:hypothetical protein